MKKILYTVKLGFTKLTAAALVGKGRTNVEMMTGNVTYATPIPPLATHHRRLRHARCGEQCLRFLP
ncbi:MAG: hypothetical protein IPK99_13700 [Flavobacteriales bacterium]|nr:hypothetical protein [Flavobacteriales bacterium]